MRTTCRLLVALLLATSLLAAGGCGGSSEAPDGFTLVERDAFRLAVPESWEVTADEPGRIGITGVAEVGEVHEAAIVKVDPEFFGDFDAAVAAVIEPFRLFTADDLTVLEERDLDVVGAARARVVEVTYTSDTAAGVLREQLVFAIPDEDGPMVFVQMGAPQDAFDEDTFDAILGSLQITA